LLAVISLTARLPNAAPTGRQARIDELLARENPRPQIS
jgi:hypothetical protein